MLGVMADTGNGSRSRMAGVSGVGDQGGSTMDFPIDDLLDEQACYDRLVALLHPRAHLSQRPWFDVLQRP